MCTQTTRQTHIARPAKQKFAVTQPAPNQKVFTDHTPSSPPMAGLPKWHPSAHRTLVVAQHKRCLDLVSEGADLVAAVHCLQEREDALSAGGAGRHREDDARGLGPRRELVRVLAPPLQDHRRELIERGRCRAAAAVVRDGRGERGELALEVAYQVELADRDDEGQLINHRRCEVDRRPARVEHLGHAHNRVRVLVAVRRGAVTGEALLEVRERGREALVDLLALGRVGGQHKRANLLLLQLLLRAVHVVLDLVHCAHRAGVQRRLGLADADDDARAEAIARPRLGDLHHALNREVATELAQLLDVAPDHQDREAVALEQVGDLDQRAHVDRGGQVELELQRLLVVDAAQPNARGIHDAQLLEAADEAVDQREVLAELDQDHVLDVPADVAPADGRRAQDLAPL
eukprot:2502844-Prymnesium_polylepis.1